MGNAYIVVSGSTDGNVTFWDLTGSVEGFLQHVSKLQPEKLIDCQKRPRTGRGSQGGRWWRSLGKESSTTSPKSTVDTVNVTSEAANGHSMSTNEASAASSELRKDPLNSAAESLQSMDAATFTDTVHMDNALSDIYEVPPFHVLKRVHQSGVNCLHLSHINDSQNPECVSGYCVFSWGDDQALHCLTFTLAMPQTDRASENNNYSGSIASSHSSAVKGVWTDGTWSFTTGLDQRVRSWHHDDHGKLTEHGHVVLSVPEPETLDAVACGRNEYQIAVAGRGMQMVKFSASC